MLATAPAPTAVPDVGASNSEATAPSVAAFQSLYEEHFAFVWRSCRRFGVAPSAVDDVVQDVFLTAFRRLSSFEGRSSVKTWLYGIVINAVRHHRRSKQRRPEDAADDVDTIASSGVDPHAHAEEREAVRTLYAVLDTLDPERREVFVLAELEGLTAPEIAALTGSNLNTVYARLRVARRLFEAAVARLHAQQRPRHRPAGRPA